MKTTREAAPPVSRFVWPSLDSQRAKLLNSLYARSAGGVFVVNEQEFEFSLQPRVTGASWGLTLLGRCDGATVAVFLAAAPVLDWVAEAIAPDLKGADLPRIPAGIAAAALESLLSEPLLLWSKGLGKTVELTEVSFQEKSALSGQGILPFAIERRKDRQKARGALVFTGDLKPLIESLAGPGQTQPGWPPDLLDKVPIEVAVEVGWTTLRLRELRSLEPGDVVVADECTALGETAEVRVRIGQTRVVAALLSGRRIELKGESMAEKPTVPPATAMAAAKDPAKPADLGDLQVQLAFQIDSRWMTLKELQTLKPGVVVDTARGIDAPVLLVVNGRPIGTGELVDLGGKVGVRVLELGAN